MAHKALVLAGWTSGLLAYVDGVPAGWIAVEPRSEYPGLVRSRVLAPLDDTPAWSVPCFFVDIKYRGQGLIVDLLKAALEYVKSKVGRLLEGYPVEPRQEQFSPAFVYTGLVSAFL